MLNTMNLITIFSDLFLYVTVFGLALCNGMRDAKVDILQTPDAENVKLIPFIYCNIFTIFV